MAAVLTLACGGRGALEAYEDDAAAGATGGAGGKGGAGGAPTTTSTSTVVSTIVSVGPSSTTAVTTTGGGACVDQGDCQLCSDCSITGVGKCSPFWMTCFQATPCQQMLDCISNCGGDIFTCFEPCAMGNPGGAQMLATAVECTLCDECANSCVVPGQGFCG